MKNLNYNYFMYLLQLFTGHRNNGEEIFFYFLALSQKWNIPNIFFEVFKYFACPAKHSIQLFWKAGIHFIMLRRN